MSLNSETWRAIWALLQHGGWVMIAIFAVGQIGWFLVCERWWFYRRMSGHAPSFWKKHGGKRVGEMADSIAADDSVSGLLGDVARSVANAREYGREAMVVKAREVMAMEVPRLNRHLNTVAVLAGSAPLLGLAGTVVGIMETFRAITVYGAGNPSMMAGGIAQALMVTEAGLVVAFPLLISHNYLQNRADSIEAESVETATRLIHALESPSLRERGA